MTSTVDRPELDSSPGRRVRITRDDRVQPRHVQTEIHGGSGIVDWAGRAVMPGPELDTLQRAGKRRRIPGELERWVDGG